MFRNTLDLFHKKSDGLSKDFKVFYPIEMLKTLLGDYVLCLRRINVVKLYVMQNNDELSNNNERVNLFSFKYKNMNIFGLTD